MAETRCWRAMKVERFRSGENGYNSASSSCWCSVCDSRRVLNATCSRRGAPIGRWPIEQTALIVYLTDCIMDDLITTKMSIIGNYFAHSIPAIVRRTPFRSPIGAVLPTSTEWDFDCNRFFRNRWITRLNFGEHGCFGNSISFEARACKNEK